MFVSLPENTSLQTASTSRQHSLPLICGLPCLPTPFKLQGSRPPQYHIHPLSLLPSTASHYAAFTASVPPYACNTPLHPLEFFGWKVVRSTPPRYKPPILPFAVVHFAIASILAQSLTSSFELPQARMLNVPPGLPARIFGAQDLLPRSSIDQLLI
ncbi:hypothetical protein HGRIS_014873 [Hohenbuehelia grisea]|uniref:Uncharacterized protein n=1 Tax=Hohenbuehelia grisea TaxID=104357 RepID=A0ABR3IR03_9AGAR